MNAAHTHHCAAADVESRDAHRVSNTNGDDKCSPFDQVQLEHLKHGQGGLPAVLLSSMSEPLGQSMSPRFTDAPGALEPCVSSHLATDALTLEWRVRGRTYTTASCSRLLSVQLAASQCCSRPHARPTHVHRDVPCAHDRNLQQLTHYSLCCCLCMCAHTCARRALGAATT